MRIIKSLMNVVTPNKIKSLPVQLNTNNKTGTLYELIKERPNIEDSGAISILFPGTTYSRIRYNEVKRRLRSRLTDTLFLIQPDDNNTSSTSAVFKIQKACALMKME